jgi:hypothetical protein
MQTGVLLPLPPTRLPQVEAGLHQLLDSLHTGGVLVAVDLCGQSHHMHKSQGGPVRSGVHSSQ